MSYGKYGFKKMGNSGSAADEMAVRDPWFALGQLVAQNWSKNYEDRGLQKAVAEYGVDSLLPKETAPTQDQIAAADEVIRGGDKMATTDAINAGAPTEAFGVKNYMDPGTAVAAPGAVPLYKQQATANAPIIYNQAQQASKPQTVFGNIDVSQIAPVDNGDGTQSTVRSKSFNIDGKEVLIPTVVNGKVVTDQEALDAYKQTGKNLGVFNSVAEANTAAQNIHLAEQDRINKLKQEQSFDADTFLAGQVAKMQKAGMDQERIKQVVEMISPQAYAKQKQVNEQNMVGIMASYDKAVKNGRETGDFSQAYALIPQIEKFATPKTKDILLGGFAPIADANAKFVADKSTKIKREDKKQEAVTEVQVYGAKKEIDLDTEIRSLMGKYDFFKKNPDALNYFSSSGKTASKKAGSDGLFGTDYKAAREILNDLKDLPDNELTPAQKSMKNDANSIMGAHLDAYFGRDGATEKSADDIASGINAKLVGMKAEDKAKAINDVTYFVRNKYPAEKADAILSKIGASSGGGSGGGSPDGGGSSEPTQADYDKQAAYDNQLAYENNVRTITYDDFVKMPLAERKEKFDTYLWPVVKMQQNRLKGGI